MIKKILLILLSLRYYSLELRKKMEFLFFVFSKINKNELLASSELLKEGYLTSV